jgi:hypothetical protein
MPKDPCIRDKFAQERSGKRFINCVLDIVGAMNTRNAVLFLLLGTPLANTRSLSSFVILCVVTFAIMASAYLQQAHSQE